MREAAQTSKNKKWTFEAGFFEEMHHFWPAMRQAMPDSIPSETLVSTHIANLQQIIRQAQKLKAVDLELRALFQLWGCYRYNEKKYETAFLYGRELDRVLSTVSTA